MIPVRRLILLYILSAAAWVFFSDRLLSLVITSSAQLDALQTVKGIVFVLASGTLIYIPISRQFQALQEANRQLQRQTRRLALIRELDKAILNAQSPQDVVNAAIKGVRDLTNCQRVSVMLLDKDDRLVEPITLDGKDVPGIRRGEIITAATFRGLEALKRGEIFHLTDLSVQTNRTPTEEARLQDGIRTFVNIPLLVHGRLTGSMNLGRNIPHGLSEEDINSAAEIATLLAIALQQAQLLETTRHENIELETLRQAGLHLTASLNLQDVLGQILTSGLNLSDNFDAAYIYLYRDNELVLGQALWANGNYGTPPLQPRQQGIHHTVARTGTMVLAEDIEHHPQFHGTDPQYTGAMIALPLKIGAQVVGVMSIYSMMPRSFTPSEITTVERLSDQAAIAIHNALLYEETQKTIRQLESLRQVSLYLTSQLELQPVLDVILKYTLAQTRADNAHIFIYDGEHLTFGAAMWGGQIQNKPFLEIRQNGLTYTVARTGKQIVVPDISRHVLFQDEPRQGALVGIPLRVQGKVHGVMNVSYNQAHDFTDQELYLMELVSDHAAIAIHNAWLHEELQRYTDTLEQHVEARTTELREANDMLTELDKLKNKFIADLSHELRTPVSSLKVRLYLLERSAPEQYPQHLAVMKDQLALLTEFIENVLDISRLDLTTNQVVFQPVYFNQVVQAVISAYQGPAEASGLALQTHLDPAVPPIQGAHNHLSQLVAHLVSNAIQYTKKGEITVSTYFDRPHNQVMLCVEDTGVGIESEDQPHVFKRFYRGKYAAQLIPGTGLGLSIAQEIAQLHGGSIEMDTKPGKGSTFCVRLPVDRPAQDKPLNA
ncbi:MAG: GAF domain-containing protein [Anaerolineae bacterium]|nr:GAF domain-containing protein [Anaerolineae bacterium]